MQIYIQINSGNVKIANKFDKDAYELRKSNKKIIDVSFGQYS